MISFFDAFHVVERVHQTDLGLSWPRGNRPQLTSHSPLPNTRRELLRDLNKNVLLCHLVAGAPLLLLTHAGILIRLLYNIAEVQSPFFVKFWALSQTV